MDLTPAPPLDANDLLLAERAQLLERLRSLTPEEWSAPTECPAWDVKGIALHVLGDDFSLLSRQRDESTNGLLLMAADLPGVGFRTLLDAFNDRWVHVAEFFSTALVVELLGVTGDLTAEWYRTVPPDLLGEPVFFVGPEPAPYWMIAAREFGERWIHQCQIVRAIGQPTPDDPAMVVPFVKGALRGFPQMMPLLNAPLDTTVTVEVASTAWTLRHDPDGWRLYDGRPEDPTVALEMAPITASALFSRGLTTDEIRSAIALSGDAALAGQLVGGLAGFFGREAR